MIQTRKLELFQIRPKGWVLSEPEKWAWFNLSHKIGLGSIQTRMLGWDYSKPDSMVGFNLS